jgi:hypothetical protein
MPAAIDEFARDDMVSEDFCVGVDVAQEEIERGDALRKAAFDAVPLLTRDEAWQQIVGEDALGALVAAVDGEGDAWVRKARSTDCLRRCNSSAGREARVSARARYGARTSPLGSRISSKAWSSG